MIVLLHPGAHSKQGAKQMVEFQCDVKLRNGLEGTKLTNNDDDNTGLLGNKSKFFSTAFGDKLIN